MLALTSCDRGCADYSHYAPDHCNVDPGSTRLATANRPSHFGRLPAARYSGERSVFAPKTFASCSRNEALQLLEQARLLEHVSPVVPIEFDWFLGPHPHCQTRGYDCSFAGPGYTVEVFAKPEISTSPLVHGEQHFHLLQHVKRNQATYAAPSMASSFLGFSSLYGPGVDPISRDIARCLLPERLIWGETVVNHRIQSGRPTIAVRPWRDR